jgi:hypothetical protein
MTRRDIQAISGDYAQASFKLLPHAGERASAVLFFSRQIDLHAREGRDDFARWNFRAAMSEFRSIFDLLPVDLRVDGLDKQWERSRFKMETEENPLIAILKKIRNFTVHTEHVRGMGKDFPVVYLGDGPEVKEEVPSLFIETVDRKVLGREINDISEEDLLWFNRQIAMWPAHLIIQEAVYQASVSLRNFLVTARVS